jgi:hypothetical protein
MGDFWNWYGDLWGAAWHNFAGLVLLVIAHGVVLALVLSALLGLLRFSGDLGKSFAEGWRKGAD